MTKEESLNKTKSIHLYDAMIASRKSTRHFLWTIIIMLSLLPVSLLLDNPGWHIVFMSIIGIGHCAMGYAEHSHSNRCIDKL